MRAYYGSKISDHLSKTNEGYLVCTGVRIARTGAQEYLGSEIGNNENPNEVYEVDRPAEEVFSKATLASFRGKAVTDDHPTVDVDSQNYKTHIKGVVQEVWQGTAEDEGYLMADLIIYDPNLIRKIENGKREISCGYDCELEEDPQTGTFRQLNIRGNHVAVVDNGRAGEEVRIVDEKKENGGKKRMAKKSGFFSRKTPAQKAALRALRLMDEDMSDEEKAEVIADEMEQVAPKDEEPGNETTDEEVKAGLTDEEMKNIVDRVCDGLEERIDKMVEEKLAAHDSVKELDELEKSLDDEDETVVVDPENVQDEGEETTKAEDEEGVIVEDEENVTDSDNSVLMAASDKAFVKRQLGILRDALKTEKNQKRRQQIIKDAKTLSASMKKKAPAASAGGGYGVISSNRKAASARDAAIPENPYAQFNPHNKNK